MCGTYPSGAEFWVRTQSAGGGGMYRYFDKLGREIRSATKMFNGNWSAVDVEYDHLGRPRTVTREIARGAGTETRQFDPATGRPVDVLVQNPGYQTVQELEFDFDVLGNLTWKRDRSRRQSGALKNITGTFQYDDLNRLTDVYQGSTRTLAMSYNALGNIVSKRAYRPDTGAVDGNADVGSYSYGARPHAVTSAGGVSYTYDANGSMLSGDGRTLVYGVFNKPISMTRGGRTVQIHYGPSRERYRRIDDPGQSSQVETHYVGSVERIWRPGNVLVTKRYLGGQAIHTRTESPSSTTDTLHYLLKDHLGSTDLIVDGIGDIVQGQSFDAFGLRRQDDDYVALTLTQRLNFNTVFTTRGFTGHEGLDPVGLVHMNGRVYDPKLGRFVSGDPFVQDPANTQNHNRYSYVLNNPLSYTDPSGYFFKKLWKSVKKVAGYVGVAVAGFVSCKFGGPQGCAAFFAYLGRDSIIAEAASRSQQLGRVVGAFGRFHAGVGAIRSWTPSTPGTCGIAGGFCASATQTTVDASVGQTASAQTGENFANAALTSSSYWAAVAGRSSGSGAPRPGTELTKRANELMSDVEFIKALNGALGSVTTAQRAGMEDFGALGRLRTGNIQYMTLIGRRTNFLGFPVGYRTMGAPQRLGGSFIPDNTFAARSLFDLNEVAVVVAELQGMSVDEFLNSRAQLYSDLSVNAGSPIFVKVGTQVILITPSDVIQLGEGAVTVRQ